MRVPRPAASTTAFVTMLGWDVNVSLNSSYRKEPVEVQWESIVEVCLIHISQVS